MVFAAIDAKLDVEKIVEKVVAGGTRRLQLTKGRG